MLGTIVGHSQPFVDLKIWDALVISFANAHLCTNAKRSSFSLAITRQALPKQEQGPNFWSLYGVLIVLNPQNPHVDLATCNPYQGMYCFPADIIRMRRIFCCCCYGAWYCSCLVHVAPRLGVAAAGGVVEVLLLLLLHLSSY